MSDPVMSGRIHQVGGGLLPTPDGEPLGSLAFSVMGDQAFNRPLVEVLADAGFRVFTQRTDLRLGDEEASLAVAQRQVEAVFEAAPAARIFVSVRLSPCGNWSAAHPGECYETSEGEACCMGLDGERYALAFPCGDPKRVALINERRFISPFSKAFTADSVGAILNLLSRLKSGPAAESIVGLFIGAHSTSEWNIFMPGGDFCIAALAGFREYLSVKYKRDAALHTAWGRTDMSLATATPPTELAVLRQGFCRFDFGDLTGHRPEVAGADWIPGSWHSTPTLLEALRGVNAVYAGISELDRTPIHDVRIFSPMAAPTRIANNMIQQAQRATEWCRTGASVGSYALEDLLAGRTELGKLNVFALCQSLTEEEIRGLRALLEGSGTIAIWLNGAGLVAPDGRIAPDSQRASCLTGIRQRLVRNGPRVFDPGSEPESPSSAIAMHAVLDPAAHPALRRLAPGDIIGQADRELCSSLDRTRVNPTPDTPCAPEPQAMSLALEVCDMAATTWARFSHTGTGAAAVKEVHGYTSVVYNCFYLPARLLREWSRFAGAHIYVESDASVWATRGLLLVHAAQGGPLRICLPKTCDLTDMRTAERHCALQALRVDATVGQTFFFKLES